MMQLDPKYPIKPDDPKFIEEVLTPVSREELAFLLRQGWKKLFNQDITIGQLGILWAHIFLEVGGGKSIHNHNFGNIKRYANKKYTSYQCSEVLVVDDGYGKKIRKEFKFFPYHPQTFFSAWDSGEEGITDYIKFLQKPQYKRAFDALKEEKLEEYVIGLKAGGYFTADLAAYTRAVNVWNLIFKKDPQKLYTWQPAPVSEIPKKPILEPKTSENPPATSPPIVNVEQPTIPKTDPKQSEKPLTPSILDRGVPINVGASVTSSMWQRIWIFILSILSIFKGKK